MKRALNEVSPVQNNNRPRLAPDGSAPPSDTSEPILKSEPRIEPEETGAFAYFENLVQMPVDQKENANQAAPKEKVRRGRKPAKSRGDKNFRANWRTVDEANDWLLKLTSRSHLKFPTAPKAPKTAFWLPEEVQRLVIRHMSPQAAANWALTCQYHYGMVDACRPLTRLPTFLQFFPASRSTPPADLVELVLSWLAPDRKGELDAALYTPLDQRVSRVMTLALMGALSASTPKKTRELALRAVQALGDDALTALSDLLHEYGRQHESLGTELNAEAQRWSLSQLVPVLLPLLNREDLESAQTWLRLARFLPLVTDDEWTPFPEDSSIILGDNAMLHIELLGLVTPLEKLWPQRDEESKLRLARNCLSDYLGYARNASALLTRATERRRALTAVQKIRFLRRLIVTRHIVRLPEILGLKSCGQQALLPQALSLLAVEVEILAHKLLSECVHEVQQISDCLEGVCSAEDASRSLVLSMLWRFGRLATLVMDAGPADPQCLLALQAISEKWPLAQGGNLLREWFTKKQEGADR